MLCAGQREGDRAGRRQANHAGRHGDGTQPRMAAIAVRDRWPGLLRVPAHQMGPPCSVRDTAWPPVLDGGYGVPLSQL